MIKKKIRVMKKIAGKNNGSRKEMKIAALLMLFFGFAEVVMGVTHRFLVLTNASFNLATDMEVIVGLLYFISGLLVLKGKKWAAVLAITLLFVHVIGRVVMVVMGLYLVDTAVQISGIVIGTSMAVYLAGYVCLKLKSFK